MSLNTLPPSSSSSSRSSILASEKYVAFRNLLDHHFIFLTYLPFSTISKNTLKSIISWLFLALITLWAVRYYIFVCISPDNILVYYLCDANFMFGGARQPLNILLGTWVSTAVFLGYYLKYTQYSPSKFYQVWIDVSLVLSTHMYHGAGPFKKEVDFLYWAIYGYTIFSALFTFSLNLVWFLYAPLEYWIIGTIFSVFHAIVAYSCTFFFAGRTLTHVFQLYIYGKYFLYLNNTSFDLHSSGKSQLIKPAKPKHRDEEKSMQKLSRCLKEMQANNHFNSYFLASLFIATFFPGIYILYCIFFTNLPIPAKFAFAVWGTFFNLGLLQTFVAAIYAKYHVSTSRHMSYVNLTVLLVYCVFNFSFAN